MIARLLRIATTDPPSEGIYHCVIEDDTHTEKIVYVGLYASRGGVSITYLIALHNNKLLYMNWGVARVARHTLLQPP